jgi:hypothetical protein
MALTGQFYGPQKILRSVRDEKRFRNQITMVDPDEFESDIFACSFYKTDFERENTPGFPKMEVVNPCNVFLERKFTHFWQKMENGVNPF